MRKNLSEKIKATKQDTVWIVLMILMPLLIVAFLAFISVVFRHTDPFPGIVWNDEAVYLKLIQTYSHYASPLGYYGFDGNHAIPGSGPAWNPAILWPYLLPALIFPTGQHFVFFVNLFYLILANFLFYLLARPNREGCFRLIGFQLLSVPIILYLCTNMSEIFRYGIAIVLAGMLYYVYLRKGHPVVRYVLIPFFILYSMQVYIFFAFALPLYICGLIRDKKWYLRFLISALPSAILAGGSYYFLHLISSNYNIGKTEKLLSSLSAGDLAGTIRSAFGMMKEGLLGVWGLKNYFRVSPLYPYSVLLALALLAIGLFMTVRGKKNPKKKEDEYIGRMISHSVALFYVMYLTLYTIVPDTFYRGTQIVVIFSLYLMAMARREYLVRFLMSFSFIGIFLMRPQYRAFIQNRYNVSETKTEWKALEDEFSDVLKPDSGKDLWDNTVLMYTMEPKVIMAIPAGLGENFVLTDGIFNKEAGYLLFSKTEPENSNPGWVVHSYSKFLTENNDILSKNYIVIYENETYIIYQKTSP